MKISNSKKQLAKIIHENGGWRDEAESAAQCINGEISFWSNTARKERGEDWYGHYLGKKHDIEFTGVKLTNWHQTLLSRDEYFHLYPVAEAEPEQVVKAEPTIEQLAADYRNKLDYANCKQDEADKANMESDAALAQLEDAIAEIGFAITPLAATEKEPELVINDWRDLRVGDEVECVNYDTEHRFGVVRSIDKRAAFQWVEVLHPNMDVSWPSNWRFIRRPT